MTIATAIDLVKLGLTTVQAIAAHIQNGRLRVTGADEVVLSAEDVASRIDAALVAAGQVGDAAAGRIEDRHDA